MTKGRLRAIIRLPNNLIDKNVTKSNDNYQGDTISFFGNHITQKKYGKNVGFLSGMVTCHIYSIVWRQSKLAFFGASASVGALFNFASQTDRRGSEAARAQ